MVPAGDATTFKLHPPPPRRHVTPKAKICSAVQKRCRSSRIHALAIEGRGLAGDFFGTDLMGDEKGFKGFFCLL